MYTHDTFAASRKREYGGVSIRWGQQANNAKIASGGNATYLKQIDASYDFVVVKIKGDAWNDAAATAVAHTPLLREPSATLGSNTWAAKNTVLVNFGLNNITYYDEPVPLSYFASLGDKPDLLPISLVLMAGQQVKTTIYNYTNMGGFTFDLGGQITFEGYKVYREK